LPWFASNTYVVVSRPVDASVTDLVPSPTAGWDTVHCAPSRSRMVATRPVPAS
jgi:hypothetical protein